MDDVLGPLGVKIFVATTANTKVKFEGTFGVLPVVVLALGDEKTGVSRGVTTSKLGSNDD